MDKLSDIDLFVRVVNKKGLAAAGREVGLSPASMTARIKRLEKHYGVKLLNRTTRRVTLTEEGKTFYESCRRILNDIEQAEDTLIKGRTSLSGSLNVTSSSDIGQQHIATLVAQFTQIHPKISINLHLSDDVENLIENNFDIGIRYGLPEDSRMISRKLSTSTTTVNSRVLCASPNYLAKHGTPKTPDDLSTHQCLTILSKGEQVKNWYFKDKQNTQVITIKPTLSSNDGAQIRRWAISGEGIALKSYWDIKNDLATHKLVEVLPDYSNKDIDINGVHGAADLHVVYPSRDYLPERTKAFIDMLIDYFNTY